MKQSNEKYQLKFSCFLCFLILFGFSGKAQQVNPTSVEQKVDEIIFKPGFTAETGADFRAYIDKERIHD